MKEGRKGGSCVMGAACQGRYSVVSTGLKSVG